MPVAGTMHEEPLRHGCCCARMRSCVVLIRAEEALDAIACDGEPLLKQQRRVCWAVISNIMSMFSFFLLHAPSSINYQLTLFNFFFN